MAVAANRIELAHETGVEVTRLFGIRAAHGGDVAVIGSRDLENRRKLATASRGRPEPFWDYAGVDALVTNVADIALLALAADCATVALADPDAGVAAVLHCGWKGFGAGIVANTVATMRGLGSDVVGALIGPTICANCYQVDQGRANEVQRSCPVAVQRTVDGEWSVDIGAGVAAELGAQGIAVERIVACPACDALGSVADSQAQSPSQKPSQKPSQTWHQQYFSYRREGRTGRHGTAVVLRAVAGDRRDMPGTISS